ncbi:unnamed protein product, partial [marine sediment metagenome]
MPKLPKNDHRSPRPDVDERRTERALAQLVDILAEIAHDPDKREKKAATKI